MAEVSVETFEAADASLRHRISRRAGVLAGGGVIAGTVAGIAVASGHIASVAALLSLVVLVTVWLRPQLGPVLLVTIGLLVEQFSLGLTNGSVTANVPITGSIPLFEGLGGIHMEPADLLLFAVLLIYMIRSSRAGETWWPRSGLTVAIGALFAFVVIAEIIGVGIHHGALRESLYEVRPFIYLILSYFAAASMIRTRGAVHAMLWAFVIVEPIKAIQAIDLWIKTKDWVPKPEGVLGHEEAMFAAIFFFLVAALWLFESRSRLRTVATTLLPLVFFGDLVNDRRASWFILGIGLVVLVAIGYKSLPHRRRAIRIFSITFAVIFGLYLAAYWNHTGGTLGVPADAIRSQFSPDARDAASDAYRVNENANLKYNIKTSGKLIGEGWGEEIDYALPMPNLVVSLDPEILYVPHNGVLYILMRLGLLGASAFWAVIGAGIILGARLAQASKNREFAAIGGLAAAALAGWSIEGAIDMGFTFPRVMLVIGCLMGLVEAIRHIEAENRAAEKLQVRVSSTSNLPVSSTTSAPPTPSPVPVGR